MLLVFGISIHGEMLRPDMILNAVFLGRLGTNQVAGMREKMTADFLLGLVHMVRL
jgi:hypothetical protein